MFYATNRILKNQDSAEDAVHNAFLRVINHLEKINENDCHKTRAFLVVILKNIAIDIYRKESMFF
ncbi:MAG: RNA polymerase sigma factor [Lachnospiraceae bacterium]